MNIIFASHNSGKICELQGFVRDLSITIIPQAEKGVKEIPETASTFIENALLKARHACSLTGLPTIADDSGLVVPALNGAPGIYSARYAGEGATAKDNIQKLLRAMEGIPKKERLAFFHCTLVFLREANDPIPLICQANWNGMILTEAVGQDGFGYDPIFFDPIQNKSAAELSADIKNQISHRGQALRLLLEKLKPNTRKKYDNS